MRVSREQLYQEVWAESALVVAARYNVSSSYLARICDCLHVPRPPRGHWARVKAGQRLKQPPLPAALAGDETTWESGVTPASYATRRPARSRERATSSAEAPAPMKHGLLVEVQAYYDAARRSQAGYLRPLRRNLVDIYVSKDTLSRALDVANQLFLALEPAGHRVALAGGTARRPDLDPREKPGGLPIWETWRPGRPTVTTVENIAFSLTLYELSEQVEMRWVNGSYVRSD